MKIKLSILYFVKSTEYYRNKQCKLRANFIDSKTNIVNIYDYQMVGKFVGLQKKYLFHIILYVIYLMNGYFINDEFNLKTVE